jgi:peptidoglycan/xylan/chitin deacetylase (PgdA/CDA1 family)
MDKEAIFRTALNSVHYTGIGKLAAPALRGIGAYMMLHHILPGGGLQTGFAPNAGLEITPEFLFKVIQFVRNKGYHIVSMEESHNILSGQTTIDKPFIVFTIDDGYRDNFEHALPVFRQLDCPFTIFIAPQITDGTSELWWRGLEQVIAENKSVKGEIAGEAFDIRCTDEEQRKQAFARLYGPLRNLEQHAQRKWIRNFCDGYNVDLDKMCARQAMNWDEVREIANEPLCTIGAHTINHYAVSQLDADEALAEATNSRDRIEKEIGQRPAFFAYPYGDEGSAGPRDFELMQKAGFKLAVTTRKGLVYNAHKQHLTALPRLSLNGAYQELHYVDALLSGLPFVVFNKFRKVNVA